VVRALVCPVCRKDLTRIAGSLRCPARHTFDIARQGYVNLLAGVPRTGTAKSGSADTAEMVADRAAFLAEGHYAPLAHAVGGAVAELADGAGLVVDAGAGTGYYLAAALARADAFGLAMDVSTAALRRVRGARVGGVVWDVWRPWPVRDGAADVVLNVFAPRNGPEFHRVLRPGGRLIVVTPSDDHLAELGAAVLDVDPRKRERLATTLGERFEQVAGAPLRYPMTLAAEDVRRLVGMGPAGRHARGFDATARTVTASFLVSVYSAR
jgi:23S rRNA (guanine745-N1)-methyltransferase